jgi:hypothetical protein
MKVTATNPLINKAGKIIPMPCTMFHLAIVYNVNRRTMYNWLKPFKNAIGTRVTNFYNCKQVEIIFEKIGEPEFYEFAEWL